MIPMSRWQLKVEPDGHQTSRKCCYLYFFYLQKCCQFLRKMKVYDNLNQLIQFIARRILFYLFAKSHITLINILYFPMINKLTLNAAVSKVYGKTLAPSLTPLTQWQLFVPYSANSSEPTVFLKLLEVPAYLYTSDQICNKSIEKFNGILHKVKLIFIERCFQSSYYLLIAEENLIPVSSLLKIKKEASEKVEEEIIFDYLQFLSKLEDHPFSNSISFNQNQIAIGSRGNFLVANYLMYFQDHSKEGQGILEKQRDYLKIDSRKVLIKMIMPNSQNLDIVSFYSTTLERYGSDMMRLVQKFMDPTFKMCQISQLIASIRRSRADESFSATVTDTFVEDGEKSAENFMNDTCNTGIIDESFQKIKKQQERIKRRRVMGLIVVFVIILIGIGAITFKYLQPRPLECDQNQYADADSMRCLDCDVSCEKCLGGAQTMCVSCKGNLYLIIHDTHDKTGRCSEICHGTIIKTKTCIDNH